MNHADDDGIVAKARRLDTGQRQQALDTMARSAKVTSIKPSSLDPDLRRMIPAEIARGDTIVAIEQHANGPLIAMADPNDYEALGTLFRLFPKGFSIAVAPREQVLAAIDELYW